MPVEINT